MNKIIAGFCVCFFILSVLSGIMDGSAGAAASTKLSAAIDDEVVVIGVDDTTGFLAAGGVLMIDNEKMSYTGLTAPPGATFTGLTRGYEKTQAADHEDNTAVYNEDMGVLNYALGFGVVRQELYGWDITAIMVAKNFVTITVPRVVLWDYGFLDGELMMIRYILMVASIGFVIYISYQAAGLVANILNAILPW